LISAVRNWHHKLFAFSISLSRHDMPVSGRFDTVDTKMKIYDPAKGRTCSI